MTRTISQPTRSNRIALITNHGYAGKNLPVGGAPDTGGQNFYVHAKARALEKLGMEVTIFTRGGFPFFQSDRIREGVEWFSDHIRYVYVPGGGNDFIRKEDIAIALQEEADWLVSFIDDEAAAAGCAPYDYFEVFDTHYWDAAVLAMLVVEKWQDRITYDFLGRCADGLFAQARERFAGKEMHRYYLAREAERHLGEMAVALHPGKSVEEIAAALLPEVEVGDILVPSPFTSPVYQEMKKVCRLGDHLVAHLKVDGCTLKENLARVNRHVWTPHSLSIIKQQNYFDRNPEDVRHLKFLERRHHEAEVCRRTPLFCATSPEIWLCLHSYYDRRGADVFDFPPCLDTDAFRPRSDEELEDAYAFLSEKSGIAVDVLKKSRIIFETSRMDHTKRKDVLLRAFAKVAEQTDDTYLFIGGGPRTNPVFQELARLHASLPALQGRAFLTEFIPSDLITKMFSVPTLFVSASEMEGFGMSVSQAAAAEVAIISSDLIPFATQFAHQACEIVPAGDVDGFAAAMLDLLNDDAKREANAKRLHDIAQQLNWETTARAFVTWYRERLHL